MDSLDGPRDGVGIVRAIQPSTCRKAREANFAITVIRLSVGRHADRSTNTILSDQMTLLVDGATSHAHHQVRLGFGGYVGR